MGISVQNFLQAPFSWPCWHMKRKEIGQTLICDVIKDSFERSTEEIESREIWEETKH